MGSRQEQTPEETVEKLPLGRKETKQTAAAQFLRDILSSGPALSSDIEEMSKEMDFGFKTVQLVKNNLGIRSFRKNGKWYWELTENMGGES